jgi:2-iminobutanoate/2-iminopropanoate deaminase
LPTQKIYTDKAPPALGPYSQAILAPPRAQLLFISGQLPLDLATGELIQGDIQLLTRSTLHHIEAILKAAHSDLASILRVEVFLTDLKKDFPGMNAEYSIFFSDSPPARQTIQVSALPKGSPLEISCIAYVKNKENLHER